VTPVVGGGGGILGKIFGLLSVMTLASIAPEVQKLTGSEYDPTKNLPLDQLAWPWGPKNTPKLDIGPFKNILGGDSSFTPDTPKDIGGGRGDPGTRARVQEQSDRSGIWQRAVAAGLVPTASAITATLEKNRRAAISGDDRTAARLGSLTSAVRAIDFKPKINNVVNVTTNISVRTLQKAVAVNARYQSGSRNLDRQP
jgi:hypothetical protein